MKITVVGAAVVLASAVAFYLFIALLLDALDKRRGDDPQEQAA